VVTSFEEANGHFRLLPFRRVFARVRLTDPPERANRETGALIDIAGVVSKTVRPSDSQPALLIEQDDEWVVGRYPRNRSFGTTKWNWNKHQVARELVLAWAAR
jgi:hypothetical protein